MNYLYLLLTCFFSTQLIAQNLNDFDHNISIQNVYRLNSDQLDFSPSYYQNGIVFVSNRQAEIPTAKGQRKDNRLNDYYMALFYAGKGTDGQLKAPEPFSVNLTERYHEGPLCFSKNGQQLFFTQNSLKKDKKKRKDKSINYLKIFIAQKKGDDWTNVQALPFNTEDFDECHPSISADGKTLIFASNRTGGFGGMDLYRSQLLDNQWSAPQNLGEKVNTSSNEIFPYLHEDGTLFFASNGWEGYGGLDIFYSELNAENLTVPTNIGDQINSQKDDFGLILNKEKTEGYFSSARIDGQGKDDIYRFTKQQTTFQKKVESEELTTVCVYDAKTDVPMPNVLVKVFKKRADGNLTNLSGKRVMVMQPAQIDKKYSLKMELPEPDKNYENRSYLTDEQGTIQLKLLPNETYVFIANKDSYETGEKRLLPNGQQRKTAEQFCIPMKKITMDCIALKGSVQQEETGDYLSDAKVTLTNKCTGKKWHTFSDSQGRFSLSCQPLDCDFSIDVERLGFNRAIQTVDKQSFIRNNSTDDFQIKLSNSTISTTPTNDTFFEKGTGGSFLKVGSTIVLNNIYYDFNDYHLRNEATKTLDKLIELLYKYPSLEIELSAHTDSRGGANSNQRLSRKRAEYAVRYLESKGIATHRLRALGYGEDQLRNDCEDKIACSETEHQYNRRTEVKITRFDPTER